MGRMPGLVFPLGPRAFGHRQDLLRKMPWSCVEPRWGKSATTGTHPLEMTASVIAHSSEVHRPDCLTGAPPMSETGLQAFYVKGVRKTYHCGGRIVYHRRDDRGPYGRWSGDCLGAREDSAGVT